MNELKIIQKEAIDLARIWARFVKNNKNVVWSEQQSFFINEALKNFNNGLLTKEIYLKSIKKIDKIKSIINK